MKSAFLMPLAISACLLGAGCSAPESLPANLEKKQTSVPFERTLIDNQGRDLRATVIGFDGRVVTIKRKSDDKQFQLPLERLSSRDQNFFQDVSIKTSPEPSPDNSTSTLDRVKKEGEDRRLAEIERELEELRKEISRYQPGTMKWRSVNREMNALSREKIEIRGY